MHNLLNQHTALASLLLQNKRKRNGIGSSNLDQMVKMQSWHTRAPVVAQNDISIKIT